ncbi:MAG: efflux RND transporter periplasmic adaptor subunit [Planctomycetes bacterium]|nr:efflux RND transporter periplasmic adaptor subunit [Planctomycetota bacterium]
MKTLKNFLSLVLVAAAFWAGWKFGPDRAGSAARPEAAPAAGEPLFTCSMHPTVRLPKGSKCPICFMDLIPVESSGDSDEAPRRLTMTAAGRALAEIETALVERRNVALEVRMVGKVDFDETRVSSITAWVPGRLVRLFVDYTGVPVIAGDHMVEIYSPALLTAQQELLQALRALAERPDDRFAGLALQAAREKLTLWGLSAAQLQEIEGKAEPSNTITILAPASGIVVKKNGLEGMYVEEGTEIYTIADVSRVWVKLDAYESDLAWLRLGQQVEFEAEAYPGEPFIGRIGFIDPLLDQRTRSVKVRVNVPNEAGRLKPGMFVRALARAELTASGGVRGSFLAGKWICPMHPDDIAEQAGACSQCGMPLVTAASLGYAGDAEGAEPPLVVPASAPLFTGRRAVVYVEVAGERPAYEGRVVVLGPRAGDDYLVHEGLRAGERVVVHGAFKIDSELQIRAKPSMMSLAEGEPVKTPAVALEVPGAFRESLVAALEHYLLLSDALAADDAAAAARAASALQQALAALDAAALAGEARAAWAKDLATLAAGAAQTVAAGQEIEEQRKGYLVLSEALPDVFTRYQPVLAGEIHHFFCPMAFANRGAAWYQRPAQLANPYFGAAMLRCGSEIKEP